MAEEKRFIPAWAVKTGILLYFISSVIILYGLSADSLRFLVWVGIGIFVIGFAIRLKFCSCPYCGSAMASRVAKISGKPFHCPQCEKEIGQK